MGAVWMIASITSVRNTPGVAVSINAGNRIPGIARGNLYGELRWRDSVSGFSATLEMQRKEQVMASDDNTESAEGYTLANLVLGYSQGGGNWRISEFLRIDNLADKQYIGSVIVNDGNLRFFEPSPGRNCTTWGWLARTVIPPSQIHTALLRLLPRQEIPRPWKSMRRLSQR